MRISAAIDFLIGVLFLAYVGLSLAVGDRWSGWMLALVVIGAVSIFAGVAVQRRAAIAAFLQAVAITIWFLTTMVVAIVLWLFVRGYS